MGHLHSLPRISAVAFLVLQTFCTLPAFAAGFQVNEISPGLQGDALAGAAAANNDVSAMFFNPATLASLEENQLYVGASEIMPKASMSNASATHTVNIPGSPPSDISAVVKGRNYQNNITQPAFVPDAYVSWRVNSRLVAGFGLFATYGLTTNYHRNSVVRFVATNTSVRGIDLNPAVSFDLNSRWALGVGFQAQYLRASFSNYDGPYMGTAGFDALMAANHATHLRANSWGFGYTAGLLFKPDLCTRIGLGYRSQIATRLTGWGQQYTGPGGTVPAPSPDFLFNGETHVNAGAKTPAVLTLSAARDLRDWTVKASAQINFWNTFDHLSINMPEAFATNSTIQTKWSNAWFGALGADYRLSCAWIVRGGVAYDQTPTTNYRDPRIPDSDRVWLTLGATYKLTPYLSFDGAYEHIFIQNQTVNVTQASGSNAIATVPLEVNTVHANYSGYANIVALALRYSF